MMISSIFLDISLLFSCCCFSFLFFFSSISDPAFSFPILQFSSLSFFFTSSHSSSFLLFQCQPSFPHSLALLYISLSSLCSSFSSENSLISTSSFFPPLFLFFLFSFFSFSSYPSVTISSIFLVISWERCSPLPHFIHPCVWVHISKTYQFLSASFRNLTNAINSTYYQAFTMRNVWESVVSEAWRGSPFILAGHTMKPDRFLNRILIGYFFFFFWRVNART